MTPQDTYTRVCAVLLESTGLQLGLVTQAQFLDFYADVVTDFLLQTGIAVRLVNHTTTAGTSIYTEYAYVIDVFHAQWAERQLARTTADALDDSAYGWRAEPPSMPRDFHEDQLPPKGIEVYPSSLIDGNTIDCPGGLYGVISTALQSDVAMSGTPAGLYGVISSTNGDCYFAIADGLFGIPSRMTPSTGNLGMIASCKPTKLTFAMTDPVTMIPSIFRDYLAYGVLDHIFTDLAETRDAQRALYCKARWTEGVNVAKAIMGEYNGEAIWEQLRKAK